VLNTVESLEDILLHLPLTDMLTVAPRICKRWHDLRKDSISIRRALFFEPLPNNNHNIRINPFLDKLTSKHVARNGAEAVANHSMHYNMLITNPPLSVRSLGQEDLENWFLSGEKGVHRNLRHYLRDSVTTKELAEKAEEKMAAQRSISLAHYMNIRLHRKDCLTPETSATWKKCSSGTTGWDVLLDRWRV